MKLNVREFDHDELWDIDGESFEGAIIVSEESYIDGWYKYNDIAFVYDGVKYSFEIKRHTSPNVSDREISREATPTVVQPITINDDEEAEYIQNYLLSQGSGFIATDDIKLVIEGQMEYMRSIGLSK